MKKLMPIIAGAALSLSTLSNAAVVDSNLIYQDVTITSSGEAGSIQQVAFTVDNTGYFTLDAYGYDTMGKNYNYDPMMYLFEDDGSLDELDLITFNDDADWSTYDSHIEMSLTEGNYVLAVSEYKYSVADILNGSNPFICHEDSLIRVTIEGYKGGTATFNDTAVGSDTAGVPEPSTYLLMGLGLLGLATRKKLIK